MAESVVVAGAGVTTLPLSSLVLSRVHAAEAHQAGRCIRSSAPNNLSTVSLRRIAASVLINVRHGNKINANRNHSIRREWRFQLTARSDFGA